MTPAPRTADGLPYAALPWPLGHARCRAVLTRTDGEYWGRCDLEEHPRDTDHALERGMVIVRWSTEVRWESP
jgi:hypothetical protein